MSKEITLITDSSACLPAETVQRPGVRVLPIQIHIGSKEYRDGVDLRPEELYEALDVGTPVKSSAPSALDYLDAIDRAGDESVVVITPAAEFTWMFRNATLGAELAGRPVSLVDSRSAAAGHGLVVRAALDAREGGGDLDDVVAAAEDAACRVELVACLETLDYLRQSGRVPAKALGLAGHLGVRPCFRLRDGSAERIGLPRSEASALQQLARAWRQGQGERAGVAALFHADRPERAAELGRLLSGEAFVTEFSAAMAIHTGPGVVGVAWLRPPGEAEIGGG